MMEIVFCRSLSKGKPFGGNVYLFLEYEKLKIAHLEFFFGEWNSSANSTSRAPGQTGILFLYIR